MNFHLKQHIRNAHEQKTSYHFHHNSVQNVQKVDENEIIDAKSISREKKAKRHISNIQKGQRNNKCESFSKSYSTIPDNLQDYKCESCRKSFVQECNLKNHIKTVHNGHRDHKCECCDKKFTQAIVLRRHIHTVHEGTKSHKEKKSQNVNIWQKCELNSEKK